LLEQVGRWHIQMPLWYEGSRKDKGSRQSSWTLMDPIADAREAGHSWTRLQTPEKLDTHGPYCGRQRSWTLMDPIADARVAGHSCTRFQTPE
jgi:hypothetical protein